MSDRGYRDEVGAAVERLERLEEENASLRAELERLDEKRRRAGLSRGAGGFVFLFGATFAMVVGVVAHSSCPHRTHSRAHRHAITSQHVELDGTARARASTNGPPRDAPMLEHDFRDRPW